MQRRKHRDAKTQRLVNNELLSPFRKTNLNHVKQSKTFYQWFSSRFFSLDFKQDQNTLSYSEPLGLILCFCMALWEWQSTFSTPIHNQIIILVPRIGICQRQNIIQNSSLSVVKNMQQKGTDLFLRRKGVMRQPFFRPKAIFWIIFCLSVVAPAGGGSFSWEASKRLTREKENSHQHGICHKQSP